MVLELLLIFRKNVLTPPMRVTGLPILEAKKSAWVTKNYAGICQTKLGKPDFMRNLKKKVVWSDSLIKIVFSNMFH